MSVAEKLTAIADNIRSHTDNADKLTLDDMAKGVTEVYDVGIAQGQDTGYEIGYTNGYIEGEENGYYDGYSDGYGEGLDHGVVQGIEEGLEEGIERGKKNAYDYFWDTFQQNGERILYQNAFGCQWTAELFRPKYQMIPTSAFYMFYSNLSEYLVIEDFVDFCDELAIEQGKTFETHPDMFDENGHYQLIDFKNCTNLQYGLAALHTKHFGVIDLGKATVTYGLFYTHNAAGNGIRKIDKIISSATTNFVDSTFQNATYLSEVTFEGVIAKNINLGACPLNKESIASVINALSESVSGLTVTFKKTAKEEFTEDEWESLIAPKKAKGWNFALAA